MIIKNKLDRSFGPTGTSAGLLIFVAGLLAIFYSSLGLALLILGALLGFTFSQSKIDTNQKKVKFSENLFGILPFGKWIEIQPNMMLGISKHSRGFQVLSQSNKSADLKIKNVRIALYNPAEEKIMDLKKFTTREEAEKELEQFSRDLQIGIIPENNTP